MWVLEVGPVPVWQLALVPVVLPLVLEGGRVPQVGEVVPVPVWQLALVPAAGPLVLGEVVPGQVWVLEERSAR